MSMDPPLDQQTSGEFDQVERTRQPSSRLDVEEESSGSLGILEQVVQRRRITDAKSQTLSRSSCDKERH